MTVVLAHAGHWLLNLAYAAPIFFIVGLILWEKVRQRREGRDE